jgi:hypothetical protein
MSEGYEIFEADVLAYDPFAGDFGDPSGRLLSDKMVRAAKTHDGCHICAGPVAKGDRHRSRVEIFDGEMLSFRWCWSCCTAMARNWDDAGDEICARQDLHGNHQ